MHRYRAYGLTFAVPFPVPAMISAPDDAPPDVTVEIGGVPRSLPHAHAQGAAWESAPDQFLVRAGAIAGRFLVDGPDHIHFQPGARADEMMVGVRFLASVLPAVLRHRGLLVLHATAVRTPRGALLVAGDSGAGKSTTAAALVACGYPLVSDDVTAVYANGAELLVPPGVAQLHLTQETADRLDIDITEAVRQPWRRMKVAVTPSAVAVDRPVALDTLAVLGTGDDSELVVRELTGAAAFAAVQGSLYGPMLDVEHAANLDLLGAVASTARVLHLRRPRDRWSLDDVLAAVLTDGDQP